MKKAEKLNWKDTNLEFVGSDMDRSVKKESAQKEPSWQKVLKCQSPNLFVWRIEQFKVVEWPKEAFGKFYSGDSYIVLNVHKHNSSPELLYDVHFWIGMHSSQDEYGTAAYKTMELDTLLDDKPIQHREVEGYESDLFKTYFPTITYMKGGCPSGFRHVETKEYSPRLFHFCGDKPKTLVIKEVKASKGSLDSGDVFILDLGNKAFQWNGSKSSKDERFRAAQYMRQLSTERLGKLKTEVVEDNPQDRSDEFYGKLSEEESKKSFKKEKTGQQEKMLYRLSDSSGKLEFNNVAKGSFGKDKMNEEDVWIIDNGETIYVYIGANASPDERKNAMIYAHNYLKETSYPYLPVSVVSNNTKGPTYENFQHTLAA